MTSELKEVLTARSRRGDAMEPSIVMTGALQRRADRDRRRKYAVSWVVLIAIAAGGAGLLLNRPPSNEQPVAIEAAGTTSTSLEGTSPSTSQNSGDQTSTNQRTGRSSATSEPGVVAETELDESYRDCVTRKGFEPGGVQVLLDEEGRPWWVKTGRDVPNEFHNPCFVGIGGETTELSSHGN